MLNIIERIGKMGAECVCSNCPNTFITKDLYSAKKTIIGTMCIYCKQGISSITEINQDTLRKWFIYNPITGEWLHKHTTLNGVKNSIATIKASTGYLVIQIGDKQYLAHRMAFIYMNGALPLVTDHINHNRHDNSWCNLRNVDNTENCLNTSISKNNTTGVLGVSYRKKTDDFRAYITVNHKQIHLGVFKSINEAKLAREEANIKYKFHDNHGK